MTAFATGMDWTGLRSILVVGPMRFLPSLTLSFSLFTQLTVNGWYHADEATLLYGRD
jgi:hypothetical protein